MQTIVSVQLLRAVAAIAVMIWHYSDLASILAGQQDTSPLIHLASGVDIFFVISGFVMVASSGALFGTPDGAEIFLVKRLCRIAPIYWVATALSVNLMDTAFDQNSLLASLSFCPYPRPDGAVIPLLGIGWTLNFGMFFYVSFALALKSSRIMCVLRVALTLLAVVAFNRLAGPISRAIRYWSDPITFEFAFGMGVALLRQAEVSFPPALRFLAVLAAFAALWLNAPAMPPSGLRCIFPGVPAAVLLGAALLGKRDADTGTVARFATLMGDSSYALYLIPPLVGAVVLGGWQAGVLNVFPVVSVFVLASLLTVLISVSVFVFAERPATRACRPSPSRWS